MSMLSDSVAILNYKYLGKYAVSSNTPGRESMAQRKMFDENNKCSKIS
jgi:hypothetical protein